MKFSYKHLVRNIAKNPEIKEISTKLLQLGHEHEIEDGIFNMEFTPNRGDCLSLQGILRDLNYFYEIDHSYESYDGDIKHFDFNFVNKEKTACPNITFLKIEK